MGRLSTKTPPGACGEPVTGFLDPPALGVRWGRVIKTMPPTTRASSGIIFWTGRSKSPAEAGPDSRVFRCLVAFQDALDYRPSRWMGSGPAGRTELA
jgi:hypothetical protein